MAPHKRQLFAIFVVILVLCTAALGFTLSKFNLSQPIGLGDNSTGPTQSSINPTQTPLPTTPVT